MKYEMKITIVLRAPFLDRIPSLKNLIIYLANQGIRIKIISTSDSNYPPSKFSNLNIKLIKTSVRTKKFQKPTVVGLAHNVICDFLFDKSDLYIGADSFACKLLYQMRKVFSFKFWDFLLEYPELDDLQDRIILNTVSKIITHDKWHSDFLNANFGTSESQFLYLPNSTFTEETHLNSKFLHERLSIDPTQHIILHSGGLGKWFLCKELSENSSHLGKNSLIVFHTSHNTTGTTYFSELKDMVEIRKLPVKFSLNPVSDKELDELVASASIGVAFYSIKDLGYKAEYMGVAAGKIGNYLKCGVPVICTRLPSLKYIEDYKCGVLIDDFSQLSDAVSTILNRHDEYRDNAYKCYRELWAPLPYLEKILSCINSL